MAIFILGVLWAAEGRAQQPTPAPIGTAAGAWHVGRELRAAGEQAPLARMRAVQLAQAELELGRADLVEGLLVRHLPADSADSVILEVLGVAALAVGNPGAAARLFAEAADAALGPDRGALAARAGDAFERAGLPRQAAQQYRAAAAELPQIAGWLALREARVSEDTARGFELLGQAPLAASRSIAQARGSVLLASGDTLGAVEALAAAGEWSPALVLADGHADSIVMRRLVYRALRSDDTAAVHAGLQRARDRYTPSGPEERAQLAAACRRIGDSECALATLAGAVMGGDSSAGTLRHLGDLQAELDRPGEARITYERAMRRGGAEAVLAEYRRARLLSHTARAETGFRALVDFAERHPERAEAPLALFLAADWRRQHGGQSAAESLYVLVAQRWPASSHGSRARTVLAMTALRSADTAAAVGWFRAEIAVGAGEAGAARYLLARVLRAAGDAGAAATLLARLAEQDSLGYYGGLARAELGYGELSLSQQGAASPPDAVAHTLEQLDCLRRAELRAEAEELVHWALRQESWSVDETLALAAMLIERGWVEEGVTLGWRAAGASTLHDPRVLRVVFPWPLRALVEQEAREHGLDPYLLAALIRTESNFRPAVVSRAGARGVMQLMPATARGVARRLRIPWDDRLLAVADANLHVGAAHLAALLRRFDGQLAPALAAYNAGGSTVSNWLAALRDGEAERFVEFVPYPETRGYVRAVLRNVMLYRALYPSRSGAPVDPAP